MREIEARGVKNAKNKLRTGTGEIGGVEIRLPFRTLLDGPAKLMSEWTNPNPGRATGRRKSS
jgi:hypothetical protein